MPASYVPGQGALLIALHGVNGGMENMWEERQDIVRLADRDGFVAVFPNGQNEQGNRGSSSWAGAWCCAYAFRLGRSDVEFVRLLIDAFERSLAVDPRRVYAMGFSNGAILAYELAARIPDRLAGVAAFAGDLSAQAELLEALRGSAFPRDAGPDRSRGAFTVCGHAVRFAIDYYERALGWGSEDPGDPHVTTRVMTIMLPEDD